MPKHIFLPFAAVLAVGVPACSSDEPAPPSNDGDEDGAEEEDPLAIGQQVAWPTDEWTVVAPEEMDMDAAVMEAAFEYAFADAKNTQAVIVIRGGAIVAERYAEGKGRDDLATTWSMGKSFASTLVGMAIDDGLIESVDVPMTEFIPKWEGTAKAAMTLENVLQMESGLDFVEDYADIGTSDVIKMGFRDDVLDFVTDDLELGAEPGSTWYYSSGDTMLLSGAVRSVTGQSAADFAVERLFEPIGMREAYWWRDNADNALGFCCIDAPPRELAKFGLLFLRGGEWDGERIVSQEWVDTATTERASNYPGYAYQWWTVDIDENSVLPSDLYAARGLDEQRLYVVPSLDLVVLRSSMYEPSPNAPLADGGYLRHFMPRGLAQYGTLSPDEWTDAPFLAPIINSIEGTEKITVEPPSGGDGNDWGDDAVAVCSEAIQAYPGYCEEVHGCACDICATEFLDCDADEGCAAIVGCALERGCRGIACATTCSEEIEDNGGVFGGAAMSALNLSECVSTCPVECG